MDVMTLRQVLDQWGEEHGDLNLGKALPPRWLNPLSYTDAQPHPVALKRAEAAEEEADDEFGRRCS